MLIVGVSFDGVDKNRAFAEAQGFGFPLLCDTDKKLSIAYGAARGRASLFPDRISYVIDERGVIEWAEKVGDIDAHVNAAIAHLTDV